MIRLSCVLFLVLLAGLGALGPVLAQDIDQLQLRLQEQFEHPVHWQNVEGAPWWIKGPMPKPGAANGTYAVPLQPGQAVVVRLPAWSCLAMVHKASKEDVQPQVELSNGSGLWAETEIRGRPEQELFFLCPQISDPRLCRVKWPEKAQEATRLALFISRRQEVPGVAPYRELIYGQKTEDGGQRTEGRGQKAEDRGQRSEIRDQNKEVEEQSLWAGYQAGDTVSLRGVNGARTWWLGNHTQPVSFQVEGPARVEVRSRLVYLPKDRHRLQRYRLQPYLDEQALSPFHLETLPVGDRMYRVRDRAVGVGRSRSSYLQIPEGEHALKLCPGRKALLRVLKLKEPDFLLPGLNAPQVMPLDVQDRLEPALESRLKGIVRDEDIRPILGLNQTVFLDRAVQTMIRNNRRPQGGLLGPWLWRMYGRVRVEYPEIRDQAELLLALHTDFVDLVPDPGPQSVGHRQRNFLSPELAPLPPRPQVLFGEHTQALVDSLDQAFFTPWPGPGQNLNFALPDRAAPSRIRIITYGTSQPVHCRLDLGQKHSVQLTIQPRPDVPDSQLELSWGQLGLAMLQTQAQKKGKPTWDGLCAADPRVPVPLVRAQSVSLPLPPDTERVTLTQVSAASGAVAVQYRKATAFELTEGECLDAVRILEGEPPLYREILSQLKQGWSWPEDMESGHGDAARDWARKDVGNAWIPLYRLLQARQAVFSASVAPVPEDHFFRPQKRKGQDTAQKAARARELAEKQQWTAAAELWAEVLAQSQGKTHTQALWALLHALDCMGEEYLAEQILRGLYLYPFGPQAEDMAEQAFTRLQDMYTREEDDPRLDLLYATQVLRSPCARNLRLLAQSLLKDGRPRMAVLSAVFLSSKEKPVSTLLRAAYQLGWARFCSRLVPCLESGQERAWWQGMLSLKEQSLAQAHKLWDRAGKRGAQMIDALSSAQNIFRQVQAEDRSTRVQGILAWEKWQAEHPGPLVWESEPGLIATHAGGRLVFSSTRDLFFQTYLATQKQPVEIKVYGPVELRILGRPVHQDQEQEVPYNGWIRVTGQNIDRLLPVTNNLPSPGLALVGSSRLPGRSDRVQVHIPPGPQTLHVRPQDRDCLVRVQVRRPMLELGLLPALTRERVQRVLRGPVGPRCPQREALGLELGQGL